ncbi:MAG: LysM peptidoglycan-binding domain-containing protein [Pseudomonadales bacterium]|nr:LysM peptidoglycan-binding domain-containing protein [Pseudomonadales bacterium]
MNIRSNYKYLAIVALAASSALGLNLAFAASIDEVRMWRAPDHTRLVFDLSDNVNYNLFTLDSPHRVVIDIEDSILNDDFSGLDFSSSPIEAVRNGVRNGDDLRIVLDLTHEINPSSFTLAPNSELGNRLVIDLYDLGSVIPDTAPIVNPITPVSSDERRDLVVAISAGHGGEDPGSIGYDGRIREKNVTLAISRYLRDYFNSIPGYKPVMIRDGDYYVNLQRRPQIARENRADVFVAVHADSYSSSRANGVTIYALSGDRADRENARRVAEKENSSDLLGGVGGDLVIGGLDDDVALTLVSLQMAWSMEQSLIAGTSVLESLDAVTRLRRDKVQQASFQVLNSPDIPSILIETGYLTNPNEAQRLNSSGFQRNMAQAIAQGIMNYFYDAPPQGTLVAWQKENGITPGTYTARSGDNLSEIAERFGLTLGELKTLNNLRSDTIQIGQVLTLPGGGPIRVSEHTILNGETLSEIAARYSVTLANLRAANNLSNDIILVGQVLKIPTI